MTNGTIPFFRPYIGEEEISEVQDTLRSGWLTTGPKVKRFEKEFADATGACHAIAVNSCTAALHLAVEALGLTPGNAVLVPTMTFAATAAVVRYLGGIPILVDCEPSTGNMDLDDAARKLRSVRSRTLNGLPKGLPRNMPVVGMMPVHVGGTMMNVTAVRRFAAEHNLWVVEDGAHAFPAAFRESPDEPWQRCGQGTADVTCFSFYANKTITTGEGGMIVTDDPDLADRMRSMSLHGLSHNAWGRYSNGGSWDYKIIAPGYKYNLTDVAAAIGLPQLAKAEPMRQMREAIAGNYLEGFADFEEIELPNIDFNRVHSWHLFPIKLQRERLSIDRNEFVEELKKEGIGCSVHWRPLHLHPYYEDTFGWESSDFPVATDLWERVLSLPIFPGMHADEVARVIDTVKGICARHARQYARQAQLTLPAPSATDRKSLLELG